MALLWGDSLLDFQRFVGPMDIDAGSASDSRIQAFDEALGASFPLAQLSGPALYVRLPSSAAVELTAADGSRIDRVQLRSQGRLRPAPELSGAEHAGMELLEVGAGERVKLSLSRLTLLLTPRRETRAIGLRRWRGGDGAFTVGVLACALLAALFIGALVKVAAQAREQAVAAYRPPPARYVKMLLRAERTPLPRKLRAAIQPVRGESRREEEAGRRAEQSARPEPRQPLRPPMAGAPPAELDRRKVLGSGVLGALSGVKGAGASVIRQEGLGSGIERAVSGIRGSAGGSGSVGLGARGGGPAGSDGSGELGRSGASGLGLGGLGLGGPAGAASGSGATELGGRGKETVRVIPGRTVVEGGLSKEVIAKVIERHQSEIRYCYEQELQKSPELAGKVSVMFVIDPAGSVVEAAVAESSLASPPAESCILARVRRWRFPEPLGGGVVSVTFPWIFRSAGAG